MSLLRSDHPWSRASESADHPRRVCHRPWTSSFSVRSLLARPSPARPRPVPACRRPPPRAVGAPVVEFFPRGSLVSGPSSSSSGFGATLIERYIYSLPDYRLHERHRRNFIEIHSFNGLLATRKVIGMPRQISPSFGILGWVWGHPETKKLFSTKFRNVSAP